MERLDKVLSNLGLLSRSECKKAVKAGRISIDGIPCNSTDIKVDKNTQTISLDGKVIETETFVYYMLNKPEGYLTAKKDSSDKVVMDLIDDKRKDLSPVGRLDKDTTGFLLITNDGNLNHRLLSAKYHVPKRYEALIEGILTDKGIEELEAGVDIGDDKPTLPATVEILTEDRKKVALTITEGRYHQVKRMFSKVGCLVVGLHRSHFGDLELDSDLQPGEYRKLTSSEIELIKTRCV